MKLISDHKRNYTHFRNYQYYHFSNYDAFLVIFQRELEKSRKIAKMAAYSYSTLFCG